MIRKIIFLPILIVLITFQYAWSEGSSEEKIIKIRDNGKVFRAFVTEEKNTNIGKLRIVRKEYDDGYVGSPDTLILNHKVIYGGDADYLNLYGVYNINNKVHILIGNNCGGSGCRFDDLSLLILNDNKRAKIIRNDDFYSEDNSIKATLKGNKIIINLGLYKGKRKTAVYQNNDLKIQYNKLPYKPLTSDDCVDLYEIVKGCITLAELKLPCDEHAIKFNGICNAHTWGLRYISNEPGFNQKLFDDECFNACRTRKLSEYNSFAERLCGRKKNNKTK